MLAKYSVIHCPQWEKYLNCYLFAYRVRPYSSTGTSPFQLLYGREACLPTETMLTLPSVAQQVELEDYASQLRAGLATAWDVASSRITQAQRAYKTQYDKRSSLVQYKVGDRVFVEMPKDKGGKNRRLRCPFHGLGEVVDIRGNNLMVVLPKKSSRRQNTVRDSFDRVLPCPKEIVVV